MFSAQRTSLVCTSCTPQWCCCWRAQLGWSCWHQWSWRGVSHWCCCPNPTLPLGRRSVHDLVVNALTTSKSLLLMRHSTAPKALQWLCYALYYHWKTNLNLLEQEIIKHAFHMDIKPNYIFFDNNCTAAKIVKDDLFSKILASLSMFSTSIVNILRLTHSVKLITIRLVMCLAWP